MKWQKTGVAESIYADQIKGFVYLIKINFLKVMIIVILIIGGVFVVGKFLYESSNNEMI